MNTVDYGASHRQVGGTHYVSSYSHWDLVIRTGIGYLEGQATKYLARHKKSGKLVQDLEKARHYVEKLLENAHIVSVVSRRPKHWVQQEVGKFCRENDITGSERHVFFILCTWQVESELVLVRDAIINQLARAFAPLTDPKPVPLSDSNKHANRASDDRASGANGMKEGDWVITHDGRRGRAGEFLQDGDVFIFFDDGKHETVKWNQIKLESES